MKGVKFDQEKTRWDLMVWGPATEIADVLTFGAKKYTPDNWKRVKDGRRRYFSAMMRHILAWWGGEIRDPETGRNHLAHAGCCLLFLMWRDHVRSPKK